MAVKVVDASAVAALLFAEPEGEAVATMLGDADLVAPTLLPFELANACAVKMRRDPSGAAGWLAACQLLSRMTITVSEVDHAQVIALADETRLTTYDASYRWLAQQLQAELVTLDRKLAMAAVAQLR
jgi:predicted nucleic acid-binding protein